MPNENDEIVLPETVGVIALPGTILFPNALLPLYIFEPRYRDMLSASLDEERIFAVAMQRSGDDYVHKVGGVGLVRACVRNPDGTSHLILQGVARIRFTEWLQTEPYRVARIERLESNHAHDPEAEALAKTVREICHGLADQGYQLPQHFESFLEFGQKSRSPQRRRLLHPHPQRRIPPSPPPGTRRRRPPGGVPPTPQRSARRLISTRARAAVPSGRTSFSSPPCDVRDLQISRSPAPAYAFAKAAVSLQEPFSAFTRTM